MLSTSQSLVLVSLAASAAFASPIHRGQSWRINDIAGPHARMHDSPSESHIPRDAAARARQDTAYPLAPLSSQSDVDADTADTRPPPMHLDFAQAQAAAPKAPLSMSSFSTSTSIASVFAAAASASSIPDVIEYEVDLVSFQDPDTPFSTTTLFVTPSMAMAIPTQTMISAGFEKLLADASSSTTARTSSKLHLPFATADLQEPIPVYVSSALTNPKPTTPSHTHSSTPADTGVPLRALKAADVVQTASSDTSSHLPLPHTTKMLHPSMMASASASAVSATAEPHVVTVNAINLPTLAGASEKTADAPSTITTTTTTTAAAAQSANPSAPPSNSGRPIAQMHAAAVQKDSEGTNKAFEAALRGRQEQLPPLLRAWSRSVV